MITTIEWRGSSVRLLDQTKLPRTIKYLKITSPSRMARAIADMEVRGAPLIGVAAAYGMALSALVQKGSLAGIEEDGAVLRAARPTATNLSWAVDEQLKAAQKAAKHGADAVTRALVENAQRIHQEDAKINQKIGEHLLTLLKPGMEVLTHCNAGVLATTAYGTATAPFYLAKERGIPLRIFADETRPRLQGASLTAFELSQAGMDVTLICDNMAAVLMQSGQIDAVITGCDRVARNGDAANKIGTFSVSILARHFGIPLYIAAPGPTIDFSCPTGEQIPIEERSGDEIRFVSGVQVAPKDVKVYNPSFDVTPAEHIAAIVTERGIAYPPFAESLAALYEVNP
jgi:methylthioribose-1-phosphate isomerase